MSTADKKRKSRGQAAAKTDISASMTEAVEGGHLEQVRDILFGSQVREFNGTMERLEDRLTKEIGGIKKDGKSRTDSLELYVKNELESLADRLNAEQEERARAIQDRQRELRETASELHDAIKALETKLGKLDEKVTKAERTLRQHILDEAKNLRNELESKNDEQASALKQEAQMLHDIKTDRAALSDMFREMALRLADQLD